MENTNFCAVGNQMLISQLTWRGDMCNSEYGVTPSETVVRFVPSHIGYVIQIAR